MSSPSSNSPISPATPPPSSAPPTIVSPPPISPPPISVIPSPPSPSVTTMASPPPKSSPPPEPAASPPPPTNAPPPASPPQPSSPPPTSPPPPVDPPANSPPPPTNSSSSPPPPPTNQPPPLASVPPESPPPPPPRLSNSPPPPPTTTPPSPPAMPPTSSPPPPLPKRPEGSPPPPLPAPPQNSSPPPPDSGTTPVPPQSPPATPPSSNSPSMSPPPPLIQTSPPPPFPLSPSPPSPSIIPSTNSSNDNAPQNSQSSGGGGLGTGGTVAIILVIGLVVLGILGTAACCLRKRKKTSGHNGGYVIPTSSGSSQEADTALLKLQMSAPINGSGPGAGIIYSPPEPGGFGNSKSWFTYEDLVEATSGFSAQNILGEGGFGYVYKGRLADGRDVAVKQLKIGGAQGEREFQSEVEIISRIHHRHLVSLVGYCINESRRLLVYEYVPNNNLYFHLNGEGMPILDWAKRVKIALGAARGIAYLHEDCHPRIIHRDIKSSNILLDDNFEARVSDFGLAKLAMDANTHITTRVMGTFGYMAPEYASSGKLTERSDVYSFGVVLLELITGRKPVDMSQPSGLESLVEWARPLLNRALETMEFGGLADPRLERQYVDGEMYRMVEAAAACVRHSSVKRPKMGQVVRALDTMASTDLSNGMRVGESEMFNPQQSAELRLMERMAFGGEDFSTGFFQQDS